MQFEVTGSETANGASVEFTYPYDAATLQSITANYAHCRQYVSYECSGSMFIEGGYGSWTDVAGNQRTDWASDGVAGQCHCYTNGGCLSGNKCNCRQNSSSIWAQDHGYIEEKAALPVMAVNYGDTGSTGEDAIITVGALECQNSPFDVTPAPTMPPTTAAPVKKLLFEIQGGLPSTYSNSYPYWWRAGDTKTAGPGKRPAYDNMNISQITFEMAGGAKATFDLQQCDTMVNIMGRLSSLHNLDENATNDNTGDWPTGHASFPIVGTAYPDAAYFETQAVTIAQGDGSSDSTDWVVFGFDSNPAGDWNGDNAIGCEDRNSICGPQCGFSSCATAYDGAKIYGHSCGGYPVPTSPPSMPPTVTPAPTNPPTQAQVLLFEIQAGGPSTYSNTYIYWWQQGGVTPTGQPGKRPEYDTLPIEQITFEMAGGATASYDLGKCSTLLDIMKATKLTHQSTNDDTGDWPSGHASYPLVSTTDSGYFMTNQVTIGQGDGSYDLSDWVVFGFDSNPAGDWNGDNAIGCESSNSICGPSCNFSSCSGNFDGAKIYGHTCD